MKFRARLTNGGGERSRDVEVTPDTQPVEVTIDGRPSRWDVVATPAGGFSILRPDGRQAEVTPYRGSDGAARVRVGSDLVAFELLDDLTARALAGGAAKGFRSAGDLKAAIPGRVLRVLVAPGQGVAAGQALVVLEAMKMENEVKAPRDATVKSVEVEGGQAVSAGQVLIRFEA